MRMSVAAIIVAAGSSSRLGQPKQLVLVDGEPLLQRAIRCAVEAGAEPVFVVLGAHRQDIQNAVDFGFARVLVNDDWEEGLASSIRTGMKAVDASTVGRGCPADDVRSAAGDCGAPAEDDRAVRCAGGDGADCIDLRGHSGNSCDISARHVCGSARAAGRQRSARACWRRIRCQSWRFSSKAVRLTSTGQKTWRSLGKDQRSIVASM